MPDSIFKSLNKKVQDLSDNVDKVTEGVNSGDSDAYDKIPTVVSQYVSVVSDVQTQVAVIESSLETTAATNSAAQSAGSAAGVAASAKQITFYAQELTTGSKVISKLASIGSNILGLQFQLNTQISLVSDLNSSLGADKILQDAKSDLSDVVLQFNSQSNIIDSSVKKDIITNKTAQVQIRVLDIQKQLLIETDPNVRKDLLDELAVRKKELQLLAEI